MEIVKCPFCRKEIEKDSFYCDQCGEELKVCISGHGFKKGKVCSDCGTKLVEAKNAQTGLTPSSVQQDTKQVHSTTAYTEPKYLISKTLNVRLELKNGAVIGRRTGDYTHVFGNQGYVSGTHARVQINSAGMWEIIDLGSSNGTFLNGKMLVADQPTAFTIGDIIAFYDLNFVVE